MESSKLPASCHITPTISNEQFIPDHIFMYIVTGAITIYDGNKEYHIQSGDYGFAKRNHLAKYIKQPSVNGPFTAISIFFNQDFLRSFSKEYNYTANNVLSKEAVIKLPAHPLLNAYIQSLTPYLPLTGNEYDHFISLKKKEIILLLLKINPDFKNILFDFGDPGKIDLESFMNQNYRFNVSMKHFSYLTGRSLTTFKRDFEKIFNTSPGRWLLEKRLQEARFLIEKKGEKPSDVYLEVGFEDLSHFSYAFKKRYGISPNQLKRTYQ
ncbi:helix-turn-helix domain-containing protein [Chitinophaga sp. 30R24]|uniref:helix-turn-helix domain-containing protein n=1 Tax=Chitinophaga sp. 30R24 TaxID=3248838 RepID=UPI003B8F38DD